MRAFPNVIINKGDVLYRRMQAVNVSLKVVEARVILGENQPRGLYAYRSIIIVRSNATSSNFHGLMKCQDM